MEILMDNPDVEKKFRSILKAIPSMQNGDTAESLIKRGLIYEKSYGCSIVDLKYFAATMEKDHLLALKLWNKKWRETMILATMLDEHSKVNEEQMDFWIKTANSIEIIEQAIINLFTQTPFAFAKAMEWCLGKKQTVKHAGLLMMGRLALSDKNAIDEMFEPFFEITAPITKDQTMHEILYRSVCQIARRSKNLHQQTVSFAQSIKTFEETTAQKFGFELLNDIENDDFIALVR